MHGSLIPRRRHSWIDSSLREIGGRQFGLVDSESIHALRIHRTSIDRRVQEGLLVQCHPGVYRFATAPPSERQRIAAAWLAAGRESVAVARSAAVLHGLPVGFALDVGVAPGRRMAIEGVRVHRRRIESADQRVVGGIRVTSVARTVFDLAPIVSTERLAIVVDDVFARRVVSLGALTAMAADHPGHRGVASLRRVLEERPFGDARFRSGTERRVSAQLAEAGLGDGIPNYRIVDAEGNERLLDVAWPVEVVALEIDTFRWHTGRAAWAKDRRRANAVVGSGWRVAFATDHDVADGLRGPIQSLRLLLGR